MIVLITGGGLRSRQIWERCEMVCKGKIWDTEIRRVQRRWIENVQRLRERKVVEKIKWTRWDKIVRSLLSYEKWFYTNKAFIIVFFFWGSNPSFNFNFSNQIYSSSCVMCPRDVRCNSWYLDRKISIMSISISPIICRERKISPGWIEIM